MRGLGNRIVRPGERLFRPLNNLMLFTSALTHTLVSLGRHKQQVGPDTFHTIQSDVAEWQIMLPGVGPLEDAMEGKPERGFEMHIIAANMIRTSSHQYTEMPGYIENIAQPLFLFHYATCDVWLHANKLGDYKARPMLLEFGRTVRNAIAHGGNLEIRNSAVPAVCWRSLTYDPSMGSKKIIGTDLFMGDLLALMIDMDDEMMILGAPR